MSSLFVLFFFLLLLFKKIKEESHQLENQTEAQYRRACDSLTGRILPQAGSACSLPIRRGGRPLLCPRTHCQHVKGSGCKMNPVGSISSLCSPDSLSLLLRHLFFAWCSLNMHKNPGLLSTSFVFLNEVITSPPKESEHVCLSSSEEVCSELKHKSKKLRIYVTSFYNIRFNDVVN